MKHKNLVNAFQIASKKQEESEITISGTEAVRLSKQQKSIDKLDEYKQAQRIAKLRMRIKIFQESLPPEKFSPSRFEATRNRSKIYWNEFNEAFGYINVAWRFTREDYYRYWLLSAGATVEEISILNGYPVESIKRWLTSIQRKITHNDSPAQWIEIKVRQEIQLSGTAALLDLNRAERLLALRTLKDIEKDNDD